MMNTKRVSKGRVHHARVMTNLLDGRGFPPQPHVETSAHIPETAEANAPRQHDLVAAERLAVSIEEAGHLVGLSRTTIYALVKTKRISAVKVGRRTLVTTNSLRALIGSG